MKTETNLKTRLVLQITFLQIEELTLHLIFNKLLKITQSILQKNLTV